MFRVTAAERFKFDSCFGIEFSAVCKLFIFLALAESHSWDFRKH